MRFYLLYETFDSMENRNPRTWERKILSSTTYADALDEAKRAWESTPKWREGAYGGHEMFPCKPALVCEWTL